MKGRWLQPVRAEAKPGSADDFLVEEAVFDYIAGEQPGGVTIPMLALRFNAEFDQGIGGSAVERAVRELVCDDWLQMRGAAVIPVRPSGQIAPIRPNSMA